MKSNDYSQPVKISDHIYWVGTHDERDQFQCNAYLILIDGKGVIIDPGSMLYFDDLIKKVSMLVSLKDITHIVVQHQDPDVCGNIVALTDGIKSDGNESLKIISHQRTAALIRHYGAHLTFVYSNELPEQTLRLSDDDTLEFIHTPYLHSPGAIATYFNRDRTLFSGDIFGGMTENWELYADDGYFEKIRSFHEEYMPAKELLLFAMTKFERYDIETIAPQHGSVLNREQAAKIIEVFKDFECGLFIDQSFRKELYEARKRIEEQNRIMNEELSLAGQFQRALVPVKRNGESNRGIESAFLFKPCSQVSGDFLIIDDIDDQHLGIMVIDVVGHGVMPGLATIQFKTLFDEYKKTTLNPADTLSIINDRAFSVPENDIFITALYLIYDYRTSECSMAMAGGVPPIYYNAREKKSELILLKGTPLGICSGDECLISEHHFRLGRDDFLMMQTDGLIECFSKQNEPFDRLKSQENFMKQIKPERSAQQVLDAVLEEVTRHKGIERPFDDDVTMVVLKKKE